MFRKVTPERLLPRLPRRLSTPAASLPRTLRSAPPSGNSPSGRAAQCPVPHSPSHPSPPRPPVPWILSDSLASGPLYLLCPLPGTLFCTASLGTSCVPAPLGVTGVGLGLRAGWMGRARAGESGANGGRAWRGLPAGLGSAAPKCHPRDIEALTLAEVLPESVPRPPVRGSLPTPAMGAPLPPKARGPWEESERAGLAQRTPGHHAAPHSLTCRAPLGLSALRQTRESPAALGICCPVKPPSSQKTQTNLKTHTCAFPLLVCLCPSTSQTQGC